MLISPSFLKECWLADFFPSAIWTYQPTVFWPSQVSHEKSANDIVWDPLSDESLLSLISRLSEFQQFDYNVPQCGSSCLFCLKFIYVLGCLRSYLASNLGCFSALNFSSDFFSLQQLYFPAPKFLFLKILNYQKKKGKTTCCIFIVPFCWGSLQFFGGVHLFTNLNIFFRQIFF